MVVFREQAACFFDIGDRNKLVGALRLRGARGITFAAQLQDDVALRTASGPMTLDLRTRRIRRGGLVPFPSPILTVKDTEHQAMYVTQRGLLGFRVIDLRNGGTRFVMRFKGYSWNPRFGPNPPSHGLSLAPDRPELWVLDAPNSTLHVFDVSALPDQPPRHIADVRLSKTMSGIGSLVRSADGRFLYVGDDGDVIDTGTGNTVATLPALQKSRVALEVDWVDGRPSFPR
jgi:DNA-binding beta-propeller fold protein YncE